MRTPQNDDEEANTCVCMCVKVQELETMHARALKFTEELARREEITQGRLRGLNTILNYDLFFLHCDDRYVKCSPGVGTTRDHARTPKTP